MTREESSKKQFENLRQKAEEKLQNTFKNIGKTPDENDVISIKELIHELQVHQTELEMQNEELHQIQEDLRRSEKRYEELYDKAPISYLTLNKSAEILDVNLTAAEKFDMPREFLLNKSFYDFVNREDRDQIYLHLVNVMKTKTLQNCECKINLDQAKSKSDIEAQQPNAEFWALLESISFKDNEGNDLYRTVLSDITERKKMEDELKKAKEKAEENDQLKTTFLANMSHEIRTPMNGILGFADLLLKNSLGNQEREQYLEMIHKSGQRLVNTLNDIIELSKIEVGISNVEQEATNINQNIEDVVQFFKPEAKNKNLALQIDHLPAASTSNIVTDKSKLESILTNLIKNAIKYTDKGSIHVGCHIEGGDLIIYVQDTGIGVPKERQQAIFNRFEQADITDQKAFEGSGLGLALIKSYVEMLNGTIELESKEGKGSTFNVTLPYRQAERTEATQFATSETTKTNEKANLKDQNLKILVAEDDEASFLVLSIILKQINCEVIHAQSGKETLNMSYQNPDLDIIFMDIKMPEMNGYEVTEHIREFNSNVYIIAQTSYALKGDSQKAFQAGINDYLTKPIKEEELMKALMQAVQTIK